MENGVVLCLLLMLGVFTKDVHPTSPIQTHQTVTAAEGEEAHFSCLLTESKDVLQVTWQKLLPEGEQNVATCNKYFGQRVNPDFRDKVAIGGGGLQSSSLVIRSVTGADAGCYRCLFNAYPEGALSARTCLQLRVRALQLQVPLSERHRHELHEPGPRVQQSNSTDETVVFDRGVVWAVTLCVLLMACVFAAVIFLVFRLKNIRNSEKSKTPVKTDQTHSEVLTPFMKNDHITQRSSVKKTPGGGSKSSKPVKCSRKLFDPS
ncbi:uncharacterized protein LOC114846328 [Betta splendens]|uniref:Uncharacterized protein LOC114846328 n=1 Tax=Betta splendens TaxID=158456 RepID=A0A6P7L979_BETSP|nr:uncharacterized protein LOC114846328 [Betta splendens]